MKSFNLHIVIVALLFAISPSVMSQNIGINNSGIAPDNSAMLDVVSSDKGILIPRVNIVDLNTAAPVTAPSNSLMVYNTNATSGIGYYFWDGAKWVKLLDANSNSDHDWYEVGGTTSPNDINDNIFTQGNVGIGLSNPSGVIHTIHNTNVPRFDRVAGDGATTTYERAIARFYREGQTTLTIGGHPSHGVLTVNSGDTLSLEAGS